MTENRIIICMAGTTFASRKEGKTVHNGDQNFMASFLNFHPSQHWEFYGQGHSELMGEESKILDFNFNGL